MDRHAGKVRIGAIAIFSAAAFAVMAIAVSSGPRASVAAKHPEAITAPAANAPSAAAKLHVADLYGKLPLSFEPNLGQSNPQVRFLSRGSGYTLFLTANEAVLSMHNGAPAGGHRSSRFRSAGFVSSASGRGLPRPIRSAVDAWSSAGRTALSKTGEAAVLRIALKGAARAPQFSGVEESPGKSNYFIGNDPKKWHAGVPNYAQVELKGIYPGIDLIYHGSEQGQIEYDFRLAPGADPRAIRMSFRGARSLALDKQGDLIVTASGKKLIEHAPVIYQQAAGGARQTVAGGWRLEGAHEASFQVASYDRARPLVIDPVLVYSTYLGGSGACPSGFCSGDYGNVTYVDSSGNAYVSGFTYSANFPTEGPYQPANGGASNDTSNVFVTKLNPTGTELIYSTYLGGSGVCPAAGDCFGDEGGVAHVDSSGDAYVAGTAYSTNFPTTTGAYQTSNNGASNYTSNVFVTKLNPTGSALIYSTYLGGSGSCSAPGSCNGDTGYVQYVDSSGNAYVSGEAYSTNFPTTTGVYQTGNNGAGNHTSNVFVTKLNSTGTAPLLYSTYLGGSGTCDKNGISGYCAGDYGNISYVDSSGNAYLSGWTYSANFPTTTGAYQTTYAGAANHTSNVFVTKLNSTGTAPLLYSTYLGGGGVCDADGATDDCEGDQGYIGYVDSSGNAYVSGTTYSAKFPTTTGVFQAANNGDGNHTSNVFVAKLNPAASGAASLLYSTYLGGDGVCGANGASGVCSGDQGSIHHVDSSGDAYVVGGTFSTNFPTTTGAYQTANNGLTNHTSNAFVTKLNPAATALIYSTYLGGSGVCDANSMPGSCLGDEASNAIVDSSGNTYVAGTAYSTNFPTTSGAYQTANNGLTNHTSNVFVTKLNSTGTAPLLYSTYLGGSGTCDANGFSGSCFGDFGTIGYVDSSGNAYVSGEAYSTNFPTTLGVYQTSNNGAGSVTNVFVAKLALGGGSSSPTPTPTATSTRGATKTPTATATSTTGATKTPTATATATKTATPTATATSTGGPAKTPTPTPTATRTATPTATATPCGYDRIVLNDSPKSFWPADDAALSTTVDDLTGGGNTGNVQGGVTLGTAGGCVDGETAALLNGSTGYISTTTGYSDPGASGYSVEIAFKTTTTNGGKLIGFQNPQTGLGSQWDRVLYMTNTGTLEFGHYIGSPATVQSPSSYNDANWHLAEGVWDGSDLRLYVDGSQVAFMAETTAPQSYTGYWRMGYGNLNGWPNAPTSEFFGGTIEKGAVYSSSALTAAQVLSHYSAFTVGNCTGATPSVTPTATATATATPTATSTATPTATPTPVPVKLKISPASLNFGTVKAGGHKGPEKISVSNPKGGKKKPGITVLMEGLSGGVSPFSATNGCDAPLPAGGKCTIRVTFTPSAAQPYKATLTIIDNAEHEPQSVKLKGKGK